MLPQQNIALRIVRALLHGDNFWRNNVALKIVFSDINFINSVNEVNEVKDVKDRPAWTFVSIKHSASDFDPKVCEAGICCLVVSIALCTGNFSIVHIVSVHPGYKRVPVT